MLLTIRTTHRPARDLGFVLHKHPDRVHDIEYAPGRLTVFYPEATDEACTVALLLELDPVALVRGRGREDDGLLSQYVNDRPYVASSFLSVALGKAFSTAMAGRCNQNPALVEQAMDLEITIAALPCGKDGELAGRLFSHLGYEVTGEALPLDGMFPKWGESPVRTLTLKRRGTVRETLLHLYTLIPVLDNEKHYWVGQDELEKLLRAGEGWLECHPDKELIVRRYLKFRRSLADEALRRLQGEDEPVEESEEIAPEVVLEQRIGLHRQRLDRVAEVIAELGATSVIDLGCGEGKLLGLLLKSKSVKRLTGVDVSMQALERADERLHLDRLPAIKRERIKLMQGSVVYRDARFSGYDVAALVEVIEHIDAPRLGTMERVVFEFARPRHVIVTTPNADYNALFETLPASEFRHRDHRFEWGRAAFLDWTERVAGQFGYTVRVEGLGENHPEFGSPSQMAVFSSGESDHGA